MTTSAAYIRARNEKIPELIDYYNFQLSQDINPSDEAYFEKGTTLLRNGVFPPEEDEKALVKSKLSNGKFSKSELSFSDITRFSAWFVLHPEKVAGSQQITTSREFPVKIRGSKTNIVDTINKTFSSLGFSEQVSLKRKIATAKLKLLNL